MLKKIAIAATLTAFLAGCTTTDPYTGEQKISVQLLVPQLVHWVA